tara:strand:+ start:2472 stop:2576 length:105 start_codon:yes stop_codon:yes gene_type:complete
VIKADFALDKSFKYKKAQLNWAWNITTLLTSLKP